MKVFGLWFGGSSYGQGHIERDLEEFASIAHARREFESRRFGIGPQDTFYVNRDSKDVTSTYFPAVDEESELWLFWRDPRGESDPYPDARLFFGPRGGVRQEPC